MEAIPTRVGSPNYYGIRYNFLFKLDIQINIFLIFLKKKIVIQIGEEQNGMVIVRNGDNKQGSCPTQYLQEV